jgi:hypothetical protein
MDRGQGTGDRGQGTGDSLRQLLHLSSLNATALIFHDGEVYRPRAVPCPLPPVPYSIASSDALPPTADVLMVSVRSCAKRCR